MKNGSKLGSADVVLGLNWGDEGKGRFIDLILQSMQYQAVARFNGGANAGHTIILNGKKIALHALPSAVHHPDVLLCIAQGCVVNVEKMWGEVNDVKKITNEDVRGRLKISGLSSVVQPAHILEDQLTSQGAIGSTGNGIGQTYMERKGRLGDVRMMDLVKRPEWAIQMMEKNLMDTADYYKVPMTKSEAMEQVAKLMAHSEKFRDNIEPDMEFLLKILENGGDIMCEGAQAWGLDNDFGATPNVTSSNTGLEAAIGAIRNPDAIRDVYGVAKLSPTRVGDGPFVTELGGRVSEHYCKVYNRMYDDMVHGGKVDKLLASGDPLKMGIAMRMGANEYGATTGRPRRKGELDMVQMINAIRMNRVNRLLLTQADMLKLWQKTPDQKIRFATQYEHEGQVLDYLPADRETLYGCKPLYEYIEAQSMEGISDINTWEQLEQSPSSQLINIIQERTNTEVAAVGKGPDRDEVILREYLVEA